MVKPKKHLGQHFLKDEAIAHQIAHALQAKDYSKVVEIGPGTGVLTQFLLERTELDLEVIDVDMESIGHLRTHFPALKGRIIQGDFLRLDLQDTWGNNLGIIGNFPYNISSQILFRVFENREAIPEVAGMFQKEVAERIASSPGRKTYGILSVLLQSAYDIEYLFTVPPSVFLPPPKVDSGVVRLTRKPNWKIPISDQFFKQVVKTTFNQRRKTLRNSIKPLLNGKTPNHPLLSQRPEQLHFEEFIELAQWLKTA